VTAIIYGVILLCIGLGIFAMWTTWWFTESIIKEDMYWHIREMKENKRNKNE